ncbi:hypothetical protein Tco_0697664 [Tanacetum coccineum]
MEQMTSLSYGGQIMLKDMKKEAELPEEQAFSILMRSYLKKRSSGLVPLTHADFSQYDSFICDLSIKPFLLPIEVDFLLWRIFSNKGEPRVHVPNVLPTHPTLHLDLDLILFSEPLFAYIVWIFLPFLTYPVAPPYLLSCGNEDTIFDLGISVYYSFMTGVSHRSGTFIKFNVYLNHLNESPMEILSSTCSPMD